MDRVKQLIQKGATIPNPQSVTIGDEVDLERIGGEDLIIYPGARILGRKTFIASGVRIGFEGPVTVENCFIGPEVELKGGFFSGAVFLKKAVCGSGAHVRQGTILEEEASIAHTVGLKQTILFPFVTLGSLINFCDCLMAGGTDRNNHSEVGSSYIHFNFTVNQDKATASLIGDVPRGVMLNRSPIFLGGQGGLVGPCRVTFGTVLAAGSICRNDQLQENQIVFRGTAGKGSLPFTPGLFRNVKRVLINNFYYIANILALQQWCLKVRRRFTGVELPQALFEGLSDTLKTSIEERIRQISNLRQKMATASDPGPLQRQFCESWPEIKGKLGEWRQFEGTDEGRGRFIKIIEDLIAVHGKSYLTVIKALDPSQAAIGTEWLESIVQKVLNDVTDSLPLLGKNFL